jgi:hypothetical protein
MYVKVRIRTVQCCTVPRPTGTGQLPYRTITRDSASHLWLPYCTYIGISSAWTLKIPYLYTYSTIISVLSLCLHCGDCIYNRLSRRLLDDMPIIFGMSCDNRHKKFWLPRYIYNRWLSVRCFVVLFHAQVHMYRGVCDAEARTNVSIQLSYFCLHEIIMISNNYLFVPQRSDL